MDQNRPETNNTQQQNVHLHMHHVCNCQGSIYPTYYPAVGFRAPLPSLLPYHTPSAAVARPYLHHYQYTQFNMGSHYTLPIGHLTGSATSVYGPSTSGSSTTDLVYGNATTIKERRDREEGSGDTDKSNNNGDPPPPEGFDYGQVTPPANELLTSEATTSENFVKFLERSCVTAEQIAYRNRNRPCFRNIQNLCIRTRSEILKACTTISNIHSQGIPWATKDFIYAFVRLTNCWHILKGYWENRDGCGLGKIEKELTPEFRACYVRWEKETMELAGQLTRIFYNLDTNLNTASSGANIYTSNNLVPPQINLMKSASESTIRKQPPSSDSATSTLTNGSDSSKNMRGMIHLPIPSPTETVDQANQTCSPEEYDSEEDRNRRVYMKPGSYKVPKKGLEGISPRGIEFLETAQNVNKAREAWANLQVSKAKKEEEKQPEVVDIELNLSTHLNVHEWLINSNFTDYREPKTPLAHQQELKSYYLDSAYDTLPQLDNLVSMDKAPVTVLQRSKTSRKQRGASTVTTQSNSNLYELQKGGLSEAGQCILENLVRSLKGHVLGPMTIDGENDLDKILRKIKNMEYSYVNEVVRDLRYIIKLWDEVDIHNAGWFSQKLNLLLAENFNLYDFGDIKGDVNESVGPLKPNMNPIIFNSDCDQFI